ncbi:hypothetical protein PVAP13_9KG069120 [Panicum virgatum]|uniref:Uncharacterized protein n=1 Tax=Panicum virgatum TaxID=38727 RepID=A0A8T0NGC9_PANVG|nr:hypothetical protein PVAP13_9KG069120 [Panicum virgatum]
MQRRISWFGGGGERGSDFSRREKGSADLRVIDVDRNGSLSSNGAARPLGSHKPIEPHARGRTWLPRSGHGEPARRANNNGGRTALARPGTAQPDQENPSRNREWRIQARAEETGGAAAGDGSPPGGRLAVVGSYLAGDLAGGYLSRPGRRRPARRRWGRGGMERNGGGIEGEWEAEGGGGGARFGRCSSLSRGGGGWLASGSPHCCFRPGAAYYRIPAVGFGSLPPARISTRRVETWPRWLAPRLEASSGTRAGEEAASQSSAVTSRQGGAGSGPDGGEEARRVEADGWAHVSVAVGGLRSPCRPIFLGRV